MSLILHQIRTDLRACRVFLWVSIPIALFAPVLASAVGFRASGDVGDVSKGVLGVLVLLTALVTLAASIGATPFVGSTAFWRTRPLPQRTLFRARSLWLVLFVMAPVAIGILLSARLLHLTAGQTAILFCTLGGAGLALIVLAAALRAASEGNWGFKMNIAMAVGWFAVSAFLMALLLRPGSRAYLPYQQASSVLVAVVIALALGVLAWVLVARFRKPSAAVLVVNLAVVLFPWTLALWRVSLIGAADLPEQKVSLALVEPDEVRAGEVRGGLLLWENLQVNGLGPNQLVLPGPTERRWSHDGAMPVELPREIPYRFDSVINGSDLWKRIAAGYPDGMTWSSDGHHHRRRFTLPKGISREPGKLELETSGLVVELQRLSSTALKDGARAALADGGVVTVHDPRVQEHRLVFQLNLLRPIPPLRGEWPAPDSRVSASGHPAQRLWIVLFHEEGRTAMGGEAQHNMHARQAGPSGLLQRNRPRFEFPLPSLQLELLGVDTERWLEEVELHLYALKPVGRFSSERLVREDYRISPSLPSRSRQVSGDFAAAKLSASPTELEIAAYLDTIIYEAPDRSGESPYLEKFRALPDLGLVALAKRLPVHDTANRAALTVLGRNTVVLPDEVVLEGLKRDDRFILLCAKENLQAEAAPILRERLREHRPLAERTSAEVLNAVAKRVSLDDELAEDLRWHFVHAGYRQQHAAQALAELEGFDFRAAIAEAWEHLRFSHGDYAQTGLAPFALRLGDKEALRLTLKRLRENLPKWQRKRYLELLRQSLATDLPPEEAFKWAVENFPELEFDAGSGKFGVR